METVIRQAIERDPRTLHALSVDSGVSYSTVYRFANAERPRITIQAASKLCDTLGLELRPKRRKRG